MSMFLHSFIHPDRELTEVNGYDPAILSDHGIELSSLPREVLDLFIEIGICTQAALGEPMKLVNRELGFPDAMGMLGIFLRQSQFGFSTCGSTLVLESSRITSAKELAADPLGQGYKMVGALFNPDEEKARRAAAMAFTATLSHLARTKCAMSSVRLENLIRVERASSRSTETRVTCDFPQVNAHTVCQIAFTPLV